MAAILWVALLSAACARALAQPVENKTAELGGETVRYSIRTLPPGTMPTDSSAPLEPTSALATAKLLERHLSAGAVEDAAMLSNAPRRRYEVLRDYKEDVGERDFRQVFADYFLPANRPVAELAIGGHSLLVWHLRVPGRYAGQFYVQVENRTLLDDIPSPTRATLRRLLEAIRAGELAIPSL